MAKKGSKLFSIFNLKCPRCHDGNLFDTGTFSFQKPFEMPKRCAACNQNYMPEPGFFYGAMFISYIFVGWFSIGLIAILHWVIGWSTVSSFAILILILSIFFVWIFRTSRAVWFNFTVKYDPKAVQRYEDKKAKLSSKQSS